MPRAFAHVNACPRRKLPRINTNHCSPCVNRGIADVRSLPDSCCNAGHRCKWCLRAFDAPNPLLSQRALKPKLPRRAPRSLECATCPRVIARSHLGIKPFALECDLRSTATESSRISGKLWRTSSGWSTKVHLCLAAVDEARFSLQGGCAPECRKATTHHREALQTELPLMVAIAPSRCPRASRSS